MAKPKKLLQLLEPQLQEGEKMKYFVSGLYESSVFGNSGVRNGILVATTEKVILFGKGITGSDFESIFYDKISSIEKGKKFLAGSFIKIIGSSQEIKITHVKDEKNVIDMINLINSFRSNKNSIDNTISSSDLKDRLKTLKEMFQEGLIDQAEYEDKKDELLSEI